MQSSPGSDLATRPLDETAQAPSLATRARASHETGPATSARAAKRRTKSGVEKTVNAAISNTHCKCYAGRGLSSRAYEHQRCR